MLLYEAIRHGSLESIQTALATGLSVDCRDKFNKTPLMISSGHGRGDVVQFLLDRGCVSITLSLVGWEGLGREVNAVGLRFLLEGVLLFL